MNRSNILKAFLYIVGAMGFIVVGFIIDRFLISFSTVQVWLHDWIENPNGLTATATVIAATATFCAVLVALFGIRNERIKAQQDRIDAQGKFEASQKQTRDALDEGRKQFLEAQYAANRPLLVPLPWDEGLPFKVINWNNPLKFVSIRNVGTGVATNVWAEFVSPEIEPNIIHRLSSFLSASVDKDGKAEMVFRENTAGLTSKDKVGEHTLCATIEPLTVQFSSGSVEKRYKCFARLWLFYSDIFNKTHASIFDYSGDGEWIHIDFIHFDGIDKAKELITTGIQQHTNSGKTALNGGQA